MKVTVIIPTYNEEVIIGQIVHELRDLYPDYEIIVIDDGSTDETAINAKKAGAQVYRHAYNIGNGAAIKSGIRAAGGDILVFMDGDGQHNPEDVATLLAYFPDFDMAVGERMDRSQGALVRNIGNRIYNGLASYVAKFSIKDLTSGFRAIKSDIACQLLYLLPNTYSYPTTLTLSVLRNGRSVKYLPVHVKKRKSGKSNIRLFRDGVRFFMIIIKICTLYSPLRIFLPVSTAMFGVGLFYEKYDVNTPLFIAGMFYSPIVRTVLSIEHGRWNHFRGCT